jgi:hypothetical protein
MSDENATSPRSQVKGEAGARWAFMRRFTIYKNDAIYLDRLRLVQTPWFGIYLHRIEQPDLDRDPHDHPWTFGSLVLRGGYVERFHPVPHVHRDMHVSTRRWGRWTWHRMGTEAAHRIMHVEPGTVTLVLVGRRRRDWGFHTPDGFVPWRRYLAEQAASNTTATGTSRTFATGNSA